MMKLKLKFSMVCVLFKYLVSIQVNAIGLVNSDVVNCYNKSVILLNFKGVPSYTFHLSHHPERVIVDIPCFFQICLKRFPIIFSNKYLIQSIYIGDLMDKKNVRFIFNLTDISCCVDDILLEKTNGFYTVLLIITKNLSFPFVGSFKKKETVYRSFIGLPIFQKKKNLSVCSIKEKSLENIFPLKVFSYPIIVAIDAGHGGHDPGAKGYSGLYEKDITIAIANKFKKLLDEDPMFSPVMIRDGDYFISVFERSELARHKGAKILLSIHADAVSKDSKNTVRGPSVWVLSDHRANIEMTHWLKDSNKWSQLSGKVGDIISSFNSDPYLNRAILDLQFSYSKKIGYEIALHILRELKNVSVLHKCLPEYSNFGILRSLDIPSVLVETGFMTHEGEEKLLASDCYQEKISHALYSGLRSYFSEYISYVAFQKELNNELYFNFKDRNKCLYESIKNKCM